MCGVLRVLVRREMRNKEMAMAVRWRLLAKCGRAEKTKREQSDVHSIKLNK